VGNRRSIPIFKRGVRPSISSVNEPFYYYDICCGPAASFHAPSLSYPPIVASGPHASTLHYTLENGVVAEGDLLVTCLRALLNWGETQFFLIIAPQLVDAAAQVFK
jgi:hypothetical protein